MAMNNFIQKKLISMISAKNPKLGKIATETINSGLPPAQAIKKCIDDGTITINDYEQMKSAYLSGSMNIPFVKLTKADFYKMDSELGITNNSNINSNNKRNNFRF